TAHEYGRWRSLVTRVGSDTPLPTPQEHRHESRYHPRQMDPDQRVAQGKMGQTHRRRPEPYGWKPPVPRRQTSGALRLAEGPGRARNPRVRTESGKKEGRLAASV